MCALAVLFAAACQKAERKDANGHTPSDVVEQMYKAIQANDFATAATFNKIPDTVKIAPKKQGNMYDEFKDCPIDTTDKKGKVIIPGEDWTNFLIDRMEQQSEDFSLVSWEIVKEEISKTDPNSAKVKTKIVVKTKKGQSEAECSFPLKREKNIWVIIG